MSDNTTRPALSEARRIIKRARDNCRSGLVAAFVFPNKYGAGFKVATSDASPNNSLWVDVSNCPERMQSCAGVYNEFADVQHVAEDLELLGFGL